MNSLVLRNFEPFKASFPSLEKLVVLVENQLDSLTSDHLVVYLKETKTEQEEDKRLQNLETQMDNLTGAVRKLSLFKGQVKIEP